MCCSTEGTHITMSYPLPGKHRSLVICVAPPGKHISLVICVTLPGKHISLVICAPLPRKHISLVICVPLPGKHISLVLCVPLPGKHISLVICVPLPRKHIPLVICDPLPRKHISRLQVQQFKCLERLFLICSISFWYGLISGNHRKHFRINPFINALLSCIIFLIGQETSVKQKQ